jgi:FAD binding domain
LRFICESISIECSGYFCPLHKPRYYTFRVSSTMHLPLIFALLSYYPLLAAAAPGPPADNSRSLLACVQNVLGSNGTSQIITPSNNEYDIARTGVILVDQYPALIVYANSAHEISPLVKCGVANGYKISPRTGSHHFENWSALSGSLVIDVANIAYVLPAQDLQTATVGGGTRLGAVYSILDSYGVTFIGGICPSVGIGGYVGVGGYNMQMRSEGLAVDHLVSATVVLANGDTVTVSNTSNPDLWWAIRGGGTYGIITEVVVKTTVLPRSAMFSMNFGNDTRLEVTLKYLNWAARQDPLFNSQLNLYSNRANILGWYLGKTTDELTAIVKTSGLLNVTGGNITISGNCSTANSRNFWLYTQESCTDDATADALFYEFFNVAPDDLVPIEGDASLTTLSEVPALPNEPRAERWSRVNIIDKAYFETKSQPLSEADITWLVEESGKLPLDIQFWGEITTFNISAPPTTGAFPWQEEVTTLFRMEVLNGLNDTALQAATNEWVTKYENYIHPKIG